VEGKEVKHPMERQRTVKKRAGQSTMEYVIVLVAIVAAILFAGTTFLKPAMNQVYNSAGTSVNTSADMFLNNIGGGVNITP
jgi:type II secretory pathway component PulF